MKVIQSRAERTRRIEEYAALVVTALFVVVPAFFTDALLYSITNQIMVAVPATLSVYLMSRMDLLSFAVPAFMCLGGFAAALCSLHLTTNLVVLLLFSFVVPALLALPLGALVLRLRGVYFVLVTYVLSEIVQLLLFEFPRFTGGSNGLPDLPAITFAGLSLVSNRAVLFLAVFVAVLATVITFGVTRMFQRQMDAIHENELLARSLGLVAWRYKSAGFAAAAGVAGIGGFSLVTMLLTAHPSSFSPISGVNYIAYLFVGGQMSLLGPVIGSSLLIWLSNAFSVSGEYSAGFFGLVVMVIVIVARQGLVGLFKQIWRRCHRVATTEPKVQLQSPSGAVPQVATEGGKP